MPQLIVRDLRSLRPDLQAAHVALSMLRAALRATDRTPQVFCFAPGAEPTGADVAARMLAHYAKPVALDGARERRYVRLEAQPAADSVAPIVRHQLELRARGSDPGAPLGTFLQERYGPEVDGLAVSCADGAFTLIAHAGAIIQAQRDYVLARPHGCGFNWLGRADTRTPESQEPALAGAVASVTFGGGGWFWLIRLPKWLERPVTRWIRSGAAMLAA